ncbi:hypothetical protein KEJ26_00970 [Candidatus Bathyarchaeota archaeon]|nr:hypothetical protein [Candidatus Bathyarchaeota archaeon]
MWVTFRKTHAYDFWWNYILKDDKGLHTGILSQIIDQVRQVYPKAEVENLVITGYDAEVVSHCKLPHRYREKRILIPSQTITISFDVTNIMVPVETGGEAKLIIPWRGIQFTAETNISSTIIQQNFIQGVTISVGENEKQEVTVGLFPVFDFEYFTKIPLNKWKQKTQSSNQLHLSQLIQLTPWGIIRRQVRLTITYEGYALLNETAHTTFLSPVPSGTLKRQEDTLICQIVPPQPRSNQEFPYLKSTIPNLILGCGLELISERDPRKRKMLFVASTFAALTIIAYNPVASMFTTNVTTKSLTSNINASENVSTSTKSLKTIALSASPSILDHFSRPEFLPAGTFTSPTVNIAINASTFSTKQPSIISIPLIPKPSLCPSGIDPLGSAFITIEKCTYDQNQHRSSNLADILTPSFNGLEKYSMVAARIRANTLSIRTDAFPFSDSGIGWVFGSAWSYSGGTMRFAASKGNSFPSTAYKEILIPNYDLDCVSNVTLYFDEYRQVTAGTNSFAPGSKNLWTDALGGPGYQFTYSELNWDLGWRGGGTFSKLYCEFRPGGTWGAVASGSHLWGQIWIYVTRGGSTYVYSYESDVYANSNAGTSTGQCDSYLGWQATLNRDVSQDFYNKYGFFLDSSCYITQIKFRSAYLNVASKDNGANCLYGSPSWKEDVNFSGYEYVKVQTLGGGSNIASYKVADEGAGSDNNWQIGLTLSIPASQWSSIIGKTVRVALDVSHYGSPIESSYLFKNIHLDIVLGKAKFTWNDGSQVVSDTKWYYLSGYSGGDIICLGSNYIAELNCLFASTGQTKIHSITLSPRSSTSHNIEISAEVPNNPFCLAYNISLTFPADYSSIAVVGPDEKGLKYNTEYSYAKNNGTLIILPPAFSSHGNGNYTISCQSPNYLELPGAGVIYNRDAWNKLSFSWTGIDSLGNYIQNGIWELTIYNPDGKQVHSENNTVTAPANKLASGSYILPPNNPAGTYTATLSWWNGTHGGANSVTFNAYQLSILCTDLDRRNLSAASVTIHYSGSPCETLKTDTSGEAKDTFLAGIYDVTVYWHNCRVASTLISIVYYGATLQLTCEVCNPTFNILDLDNKPLSFANATITLSNGLSTSIQADKFGRIPLIQEPTGLFQLQVNWQGIQVLNRSYLVTSSQEVDAVCNVCTQTLEFEDVDGQPLVGAITTITLPNETEIVCNTNTKGQIVLAQIPTGNIKAQVAWQNISIIDKTFTISPLGVVREICPVCSPTLIIADSAGSPLPNVLAKVYCSNNTETSLQADFQGRIELRQIPAGNYRLQVYWKDAIAFEQTYSLSTSTEITVQTNVPPLTAQTELTWGGGRENSTSTTPEVTNYLLTISVFDKTGKPVGGILILIKDAATNVTIASAITDNNGEAILKIPEGDYIVEAQNAEKIQQPISLTQDTKIEIQIPINETPEIPHQASTVATAIIAVLGSILFLALRRRRTY